MTGFKPAPDVVDSKCCTLRTICDAYCVVPTPIISACNIYSPESFCHEAVSTTYDLGASTACETPPGVWSPLPDV